jgi:hypothetical protein
LISLESFRMPRRYVLINCSEQLGTYEYSQQFDYRSHQATRLPHSRCHQHDWYHLSRVTNADDIQNQGAATLARRFDAAGRRTIGYFPRELTDIRCLHQGRYSHGSREVSRMAHHYLWRRS